MDEGAKVWVPHPTDEGEVRATFLAIAIDEPISVKGIDRDAALGFLTRKVRTRAPLAAFPSTSCVAGTSSLNRPSRIVSIAAQSY
jgi:hypothetical protein